MERKTLVNREKNPLQTLWTPKIYPEMRALSMWPSFVRNAALHTILRTRRLTYVCSRDGILMCPHSHISNALVCSNNTFVANMDLREFRGLSTRTEHTLPAKGASAYTRTRTHTHAGTHNAVNSKQITRGVRLHGHYGKCKGRHTRLMRSCVVFVGYKSRVTLQPAAVRMVELVGWQIEIIAKRHTHTHAHTPNTPPML